MLQIWCMHLGCHVWKESEKAENIRGVKMRLFSSLILLFNSSNHIGLQNDAVRNTT